MKESTRFKFNQVTEDLAKINGVASVAHKFTVEPSVQQKLEDKAQESSEFLGKINVVVVPEMSGELIGLGITRPIASRTNTNTTDRQATDPTGLDGREYVCKKTDFDTAIKYNKLDIWAKFKDFYNRIRALILKRQTLDRIMIGFNGVRAAAETDIAANPLLQDVNIGWLEKQRVENEDRTMTSGATPDKIKLGVGGDYINHDALVMDMVQNLLPSWNQKHPDLVVLCSSNTLSDKYFPLVNKEQENSEKIAADLIISQKRMGNLPVYAPPFFPDDVIVVTTFSNLSIYTQEGARRRLLIDNPKRDQIENYESANEAYVIEDLELMAMAENIEAV